MAATFELYGADGTLQLNLASSLLQTLGVINIYDYPANGSLVEATVYIPGWVGKRGWFAYEGDIGATTVYCPFMYRTGDSLYFKISKQNSAQPRIKYGVY